MRSRDALRDYQINGIDFLLKHRGAGLFQDMGLGKSATALTVISELRRFGYGPVLVVGPIRVIETVWRQEAQEWSHLKHLTFSLVRGNEQQRRKALLVPADIYLVNPDLLRWLFKTLRKPYIFEALFIDESSMFKKAGTRRFRAIRYKVKLFRRRYIMTGTPRPNRLEELWPQLFVVDGGKRLCRRFTDFKSRFFEPVVPDNPDPLHPTKFIAWAPKEGAENKIYSLIADVVFRTDNPNLVKPQFNPVKVILPPKARRIYDEMEDKAFAEIETKSHMSAANAAVAMMKCRQIANGVVYTTPSEFDENPIVETKLLHREKLAATLEIVEETGSPVIVVYNFLHELKLLKETLAEYNPIALKDEDPIETISRWNLGRIPVLLLHPRSGGHGLNLQHGGHTMIWFGLTFSYEDYIQTIARINRQGQKHSVIIHLIIAIKTIDQLLVRVLKAKEKGQINLFTYLKEYREQQNAK
jgi:SNF2 family DNA or RNA helicase